MASPDVVAPALLLTIPLISFPLSVYNWFVHRSTIKGTVLFLLAVLAAVSGGTALSIPRSESLRITAKVFANLLHATLSGISIYVLGPSFQDPALRFLGFCLSLTGLLVICELISALIPTSPPLLPAVLALVSRLLLTLASATTILLSCRRAAVSREIGIEKASESPTKSPGRVPSPTQATWPFPGSLVLQGQPKCPGCPTDRFIPPFTRTHGVDKYACKADNQSLIFLPLVLTIAQIFATLSAALYVTASTLADSGTSRTNKSGPRILLASAACMLLWAFMVLVTIQMLPAAPPPYSPEKQVAVSYEQRQFGVDIAKTSHDNPVTRTPKPSLSRRGSSSLDFLSLQDPFASSPPPPPPLPPVGLGLDEVEVGWNGNKEIGMQYRFPAPRSIVKGGRRKGKIPRINGKKRLAHQDSARTLLPVLETRATEVDVGGDKEFGDEARLAQLLLQSLGEGGEDSDGPSTSTPVQTVQPPQAAHVQQSSRWSASTTVQSIVSGSISNRSGVSTYTTCASDKVPTSRFSMNTFASALGSRKSSETKRKSATTASSSKG